MQSTINQRLKFLVDSLAKSSREFSLAINESPTTTHNYTGKRNAEPRAEYLTKVLSHFGHINARWLMTGQGEAFGPELAEEPRVLYQSPKKNSGNVIGTNHGTATVQHPADCERELRAALDKIALLTQLVDEKERTVQILLDKQRRP